VKFVTIFSISPDGLSFVPCPGTVEGLQEIFLND